VNRDFTATKRTFKPQGGSTQWPQTNVMHHAGALSQNDLSPAEGMEGRLSMQQGQLAQKVAMVQENQIEL
jgi:hypothetical protein